MFPAKKFLGSQENFLKFLETSKILCKFRDISGFFCKFLEIQTGFNTYRFSQYPDEYPGSLSLLPGVIPGKLPPL